MSCANYRHDGVELHTGETRGDFACIKGRVVVCRRCKTLIDGDEGSEYLHGRSLLRVVGANAVHAATVSEQERVSLLTPRSNPAWTLD